MLPFTNFDEFIWRIATMYTVEKAALIVIAMALAACETMDLDALKIDSMKLGSSDEEATAFETCTKPIGKLAVIERQNPAILAQYQLRSPVPLLQLIATQSNCFAVIDLSAEGKAFRAEEAERVSQGLAPGSVVNSRRAAAEFYLMPQVEFSNEQASGWQNLVTTFTGNNLAQTAAGTTRFTSAKSVLFVNEVATGVQKYAAAGSAKATDFATGYGLDKLIGFTAIGGYSDTDEGRVVAGALLDAFNALVVQLKTHAGT